jgi:hypothetical protein
VTHSRTFARFRWESHTINFMNRKINGLAASGEVSPARPCDAGVSVTMRSERFDSPWAAAYSRAGSAAVKASGLNAVRTEHVLGADKFFAQERVSSSRTALSKFPAKAGNLLATPFVLSPRSPLTSRGPLSDDAKIVIFRVFRGFIPRKMLFASCVRRDPSSRDSFVMASPSQTK